MNFFTRLFHSKKSQQTANYQTFTYYLPAPPARKLGYREKHFDLLTHQLLNRGYEIINIQTVAHQTEAASGMWVLFTLKAITPQAAKLDLNLEDELLQSLQAAKPEGLVLMEEMI